ncbi:MAG: hypothetical protein HS111_33825 [Kofleriaceae bacterium]|nr:hypothetical protein [Kofleriaceae bacterium]
MRRASRGVGVTVIALALAAAASPASADAGARKAKKGKPAQDEGAPEAPTDEPAGFAGWGDGEEEGPSGSEPLSIAGRVFARAVASSVESEPWRGEVQLDSARLGVNYRWKDRVRTKVSFEAAGGEVEVRDAFVEVAASRCVRVRAGRFKLPVSAVELASAWQLPTIDRGQVAEVLEDGLTLTGRRDAVQVRWEPVARARVTVAVSQSVSTAGADPSRPLADGAGLAATVRGELDVVAGVRVGAVASTREVIDGATARRYPAAALDLELDLDDAKVRGLARGLRLWADVVVGQSHLGAVTAGRERTSFVATHAAAGWRAGGRKKGKPYVEPYILGGLINPSLARKRDDVSEVIAGVAAGRWKRWRAQAQLSVVTARGLRPAGLRGAQRDLDDELRATVQLGAAF